MLRRCWRRRPPPGGSLYRRSAPTWLEIHSAEARDLASVADLEMCERLAFRRSSSETSPLHGAVWLAAALENSSAFSLPGIQL